MSNLSFSSTTRNLKTTKPDQHVKTTKPDQSDDRIEQILAPVIDALAAVKDAAKAWLDIEAQNQELQDRHDADVAKLEAKIETAELDPNKDDLELAAMHSSLGGAKARVSARTVDKQKDTGPARATLHTAYQRFREAIGPVVDQAYRARYDAELKALHSRYDPKHYLSGFNPADVAHQSESVRRIQAAFYRGALTLDQVHTGLADDARTQLDALRRELTGIGIDNLPPAKPKFVLQPPKGPALVDLDQAKRGVVVGAR
jgi:hypothetical protein